MISSLPYLPMGHKECDILNTFSEEYKISNICFDNSHAILSGTDVRFRCNNMLFSMGIELLFRQAVIYYVVEFKVMVFWSLKLWYSLTETGDTVLKMGYMYSKRCTSTRHFQGPRPADACQSSGGNSGYRGGGGGEIWLGAQKKISRTIKSWKPYPIMHCL